MGQSFSIWQLEYARCDCQPVSSVIYGAHNQGEQVLTFSYTLVSDGEHLILVDCGFVAQGSGETLAQRFGVTDCQPPATVLGRLGVRPEDVDMVILTHAHYDHAGALRFFPRAQVYLLAEELHRWIDVFSYGPRFSFLTAAVDPGDLAYLVDLVLQGRCTLLPSVPTELVPGLTVMPAVESHTYGSLYVVVQSSGGSAAGRWVVVGDNIYSYDNIAAPDGVFRPIGFVFGSNTRNLQVMQEMLGQVGGDPGRLIIGHEMRTWDRFPSRTFEDGLHVAELCLRDGERSRLA